MINLIVIDYFYKNEEAFEKIADQILKHLKQLPKYNVVDVFHKIFQR